MKEEDEGWEREQEEYVSEFKRQLKIFGLENEGYIFWFKNMSKGYPYNRCGLCPEEKPKEIFVDITYGMPSIGGFRKRIRHEMYHRKRELKGRKKEFGGEFMATMAEYFDFIARM